MRRTLPLLAIFLAGLFFFSCQPQNNGGMPFKKFMAAQLDYHRNGVDELLAKIEKSPDPAGALAFRPGKDRAQIGWQLMHIAAADDSLLNGMLTTNEPLSAAHVETYQGSKRTPDEIPDLPLIKKYLKDTRDNLKTFIADMDMSKLNEKPHEKSWGTHLAGLQNALFHEAHHQGQAHLTFNLYKVHKGIANERK